MEENGIPTIDELEHFGALLNGSVKTKKVKKYDQVFKGDDGVEVLRNELDEDEAVAMMQNLMENGYFVSLDKKDVFRTGKYQYALLTVPTREQIREYISDEWVQEILEFSDVDGDNEEWVLKKDAGDIDETRVFLRPGLYTSLKACKLYTKTNIEFAVLREILDTNFIERHVEWNKTFKDGCIFQRVGDDIELHYWLFEMGGPVTPRDFVAVKRIIEYEDGSVLLIERSIEHGLKPVTSQAIRCELFQFRWLRLCDDGRTEIIVVNETDIKGWIPTAAVNAGAAMITKKEVDHIKSAALSTLTDNEDEISE